MYFHAAGRHKPLYLALKNALTVSAGLTLSLYAVTASAQSTGAAVDSAGPPAESRVQVTQNQDWVPLDQLTEEQKGKARSHCCGAYVEPERDYDDADQEPAGAPLKITADSTEGAGSTATLSGDVQASQGYRQVRSDKAVVDREARTVNLDGDIVYREPGFLFTGDKADVNLESGQLAVEDVSFVIHESGVRGRADTLTRPSEDRIHIDNAFYTTCEPGNDSWALRASSVEIDTIKSFAVARNVRLEVNDWPVLYTPWLSFPVSDNRTSGLLFPSVLTGNDNGLDVAQPIYLNLAPHYDATVTPRYIQERGPMAELEFRHLSRSTRTVLAGGYLSNDRGGSQNDLDYAGQDRWTTSVEHEGGIGRHWSTLIDYTDVSDINFFRDIDSASLAVSSASHLNQQVRFGYRVGNWDLAIQRQEFETLILGGLEQYQQIPRVDANGNYRLGDSDIVVDLLQHYVTFDHSDDDAFGSGTPLNTDDRNTTVTGSRFRANYSVMWDKEWLWGHFRPKLTAKYITYDLDDPLLGQQDASPNAFVPVSSLDTGLYFERDTPMFAGYIHTLEPRLYYVHAAYEDQSAIPNFDTSDLTFSYHQLFRDDRFSGGDRIGDTEQATLGLTTRLIDNRTGQERIRFSIGQVYYIADRRVTLVPQEAAELTRDSSDIAMELGGVLSDRWRLQTDLLANDEASVLNKGSVSLRYNDAAETLFNLSYRYTRRENVLSGNTFVRSDIDQVDTSFAVPLSADWNLLGRYNYDLNTNQELEVFAGLQYASCCWSVSVVARRWIDRDDNYIIGAEDLEHNNGIFFQVQFRGLAGTGTRIDTILSEGIYGYQPQDY